MDENQGGVGQQIGALSAAVEALDSAHDMLELARQEVVQALAGMVDLLERMPDDLRDAARAIAAAAVRRRAGARADDPTLAMVARLVGAGAPKGEPAPAVVERGGNGAAKAAAAVVGRPPPPAAPWPAEIEGRQAARPIGRPPIGSMSLARALALLRERGYSVTHPAHAGGAYRVGELRLSRETLVGMAERVEAGLAPTLPDTYRGERPDS